MTDMQIRYWTLKEQERSNRVNESIKQLEADTKVKLTDAQIDKIKAEIPKIQAEVELVKAQTDLTKVQKDAKIQEIVHNAVGDFKEITGIKFTEDSVSGFLKGFGSGLGKSLGIGLIG